MVLLLHPTPASGEEPILAPPPAGAWRAALSALRRGRAPRLSRGLAAFLYYIYAPARAREGLCCSAAVAARTSLLPLLSLCVRRAPVSWRSDADLRSRGSGLFRFGWEIERVKWYGWWRVEMSRGWRTMSVARGISQRVRSASVMNKWIAILRAVLLVAILRWI